MKTCSLDSFLAELKPWLSGNFIHKATSDPGGQFTLHFLDGTKNVYQIDDCTKPQVEKICADLKKEGIAVELG